MSDTRTISPTSLHLLFATLFWLISPYGAIFVLLAIVGCTKRRLTDGKLKYVLFLISLSFAVLAFTQKSLYWEDTDIARYYSGLSGFLGQSADVLLLVFSSEILTYTFTTVNVSLVLIFKNVQVVSIFWTFFIYYFFFLSLLNFIKSDKEADRLLYNTNVLRWVVFALFGGVLFTQVTETIKSAAAISFFFYILSLHIKGAGRGTIAVLYFFNIGIHAQALMFFPLFFFRNIRFRNLLVLTVAAVCISPMVNLMQLAIDVLPSGGWGDLLLAKADDYSGDMGGASTKRYILIGLILLSMAVFLRRKGLFDDTSRRGNIVLLYVLIMFLNYNNSNAFIRFANFCSFVATLEFLELLKLKKEKWMSFAYMAVFMMLNLQMTYGRTLSGGYCSSYMDNSIVRIFTSNIYDYLSYKAYP
ncbi:EpsG family protein [Alistipes sp.]|uniref:EpsG family protein n=1 Tax=Alistipes sp. TaxID=1872444 RepID=UPI0011DE307C|nr:EpsG family protein [Alistipes sp.]